MPVKRKEGKEGRKKYGDHAEEESLLCDDVIDV